MGSCCGGGARSSVRKVAGYLVTTVTGEKIGPFLTATEARIKLQEKGGGTITEVKTAQ